MKVSPITLLACAALSLAACGPLGGVSPLESVAIGAATSLVGDDDSAQSGAAPALTRAQLDEIDANLMYVGVLSRDVAAFVFEASTNGTKVTWLSEDGLSLVLNRGILVGTRGFGPDLMGADAPLQIANGEVSNYKRTLDFLDGLDQISRQSFACESRMLGHETLTFFERSYETHVYEEVCRGENETFTNKYWRGSDGEIRQARQWVSRDLGYLRYQRL